MQFCSMLHKLAFQEYLVLLYLVLCSLHEKKCQMLFLMTKSGELLLENFWWTSGEIANIGWVGVISLAPPSVYSQAHNLFLVFLLNKRSYSLFCFIVCKKVYSLLLKLEILYVQPDLLSKGPFTQCTELHSWMLIFDRGVVLCLFACLIEKNDKERANIVHLETMSGRKKHALGEEICC